MVITKEQLEAKRQEYLASREEHLAHAYALAGAIQACDYWLAQLAQPQPGEGADATAPNPCNFVEGVN